MKLWVFSMVASNVGCTPTGTTSMISSQGTGRMWRCHEAQPSPRPLGDPLDLPRENRREAGSGCRGCSCRRPLTECLGQPPMRHSRGSGRGLHLLGDLPRNQVDIGIFVDPRQDRDGVRDAITARPVAADGRQESSLLRGPWMRTCQLSQVARLPCPAQACPDAETKQHPLDVERESMARGRVVGANKRSAAIPADRDRPVCRPEMMKEESDLGIGEPGRSPPDELVGGPGSPTAHARPRASLGLG